MTKFHKSSMKSKKQKYCEYCGTPVNGGKWTCGHNFRGYKSFDLK